MPSTKIYRIGLRQRILTAPSAEEIKKLLAEGTGFIWASPKTRRAWKNAAKRREAELQTA